MGWHRAAWTSALAIAIVLLAAGTASAFQFKGCISASGAGPCASIGGNTHALDQPAAVVVSPDGRHVYVAAAHGSAVGIYARDPGGGGLNFLGCISRGGAGPCTPVNHDRALRGARALVMSPDGRFLYVAAGFADIDLDPDAGDTISVFARNADTGGLTLIGCQTTNDDPDGLCAVTDSGVLNDPAALAMAPDGDELYVVGDGGNTVGFFRRDGGTGQLGTFDCLGQGALCDGLPSGHTDALLDPASVAVTRDGRFVYVAARTGDAVARFGFDNANGTLSYLGCVGASTAGGCSSIANSSALDAPVSLVVSPDGGNLFAAAHGGSAIAAFAINPNDGSLGFTGCDGSGACAPIGNANAVNAPTALATSPSGGRVYTAAGNAIGIFARSVSADPLGFLGCISADGSGPCANAANGAAFSAPSALAVSPDGRHLYGTARNGHAIALLAVSPPACSPVTTSTPFRVAVRVQLNCADPDGGDPLSFAVGGPANGTLSELSGNSVLFTPLRTFSGGQGIFDFTASDIDGAAGARATIDVGRRPRRLNQTIKTRFAFNRTHTWILRMQVLRVPGDAKVQVRCKKPKRLGKKACPFKRKSAKPKRHRATVDIKKKMFRKKQRKLPAGVRLQVRITAPGAIGKVVNYKLRRNKLPRSTDRCLPPGAKKPRKRC